MSRGLGKIQRRILEALEYEVDKNKKKLRDAGSLNYQVVNGVGYWNDEDELTNGMTRAEKREYFKNSKPTESQYQSIARAIRSLEKSGSIHSWQVIGDGWSSSNKGGDTHKKMICLMRFKEDAVESVRKRKEEKDSFIRSIRGY